MGRERILSPFVKLSPQYLRKEWKTLSDADKAPFVEQHRQEKLVYNRKLREYVRLHGKAPVLSEKKTGYWHFVRHRLPGIYKDLWSNREIAKTSPAMQTVAAEWRALSEEEKERWRQMGVAAKAVD